MTHWQEPALGLARRRAHDSRHRDGRGPGHGRRLCGAGRRHGRRPAAGRSERVAHSRRRRTTWRRRRRGPRSSPSSSTSRIAAGIARLAARAAELGPLRAVAHAAGVSPTMADWREILTDQPRRHRAARRRVPRPGADRGPRSSASRSVAAAARAGTGRPAGRRRARRSVGRRFPREDPRGRRARDRGSRHGLHVVEARRAPAGPPGGRAVRSGRRAHLLGHARDHRHAHGTPGGGGPRHQRHARRTVSHQARGPCPRRWRPGRPSCSPTRRASSPGSISRSTAAWWPPSAAEEWRWHEPTP